MNAWRAASTFDAAQSQPLTWLTSIARNKAIDALRRRQAQPQGHSAPVPLDAEGQEDEEWLARLPDDGPGPLELLSRASDARALARCMQGLSAQQKQSVALSFFDGLSHAEVAEQLHQPLGTVKSWVRRALIALKDCLDAALQRDEARAGASAPDTRREAR